MKNLAIALTTTLALVCAPAVQAKSKPRLTGEAALAKMLEGREAGDPVNCLPYSAGDSVRVINKTAIVYGHGATIWVNRPANADSLHDGDILVRSSHTAQVCNLDIVHLMDQTSKMETGTVGLGQFVPWRKASHHRH